MLVDGLVDVMSDVVGLFGDPVLEVVVCLDRLCDVAIVRKSEYRLSASAANMSEAESSINAIVVVILPLRISSSPFEYIYSHEKGP